MYRIHICDLHGLLTFQTTGGGHTNESYICGFRYPWMQAPPRAIYLFQSIQEHLEKKIGG